MGLDCIGLDPLDGIGLAWLGVIGSDLIFAPLDWIGLIYFNWIGLDGLAAHMAAAATHFRR
jgi:hypothetical protein